MATLTQNPVLLPSGSAPISAPISIAYFVQYPMGKTPRNLQLNAVAKPSTVIVKGPLNGGTITPARGGSALSGNRFYWR